MDRRDTARLFRARLGEAMEKSALNRSSLARRIGMDRSTLSQLLSDEHDRLPRAETMAALATALQVSLDWLLGLSKEAKLGADILHESMQVTPSSGSPVDVGLARWRAEAIGYKIRYVPTTLPDLVKTDEVIEHEYRFFSSRDADQAIAESHGKLAYWRLPETDMEVCMPVQDIAGFARGEGLWRELPARARADQFERMIRLVDELYPSLRLYLYDGLTHYSVPYTVFGPIRAAIYIGQTYFVFNTTEHIRVLTRHFDALVRAAVVHAADSVGYLTNLREETPEAAISPRDTGLRPGA